MSITNDFGRFEFTASSNVTDDKIVSNRPLVTDTKNGVNIRVSIFFDGTNNNKFNTESRLEYDKMMDGQAYDKEKSDAYQKHEGADSYENDYSNVARLFQFHQEDVSDAKNKHVAEYVEGIATLKYEGDSKLDGATGAGSRGVPAKVKKACKQLAEKIDELTKRKVIESLTIDVFGFSRGAAAARHFLYEISKGPGTRMIQTGPRQFIEVEIPARGALGEALKENRIMFDGEIKIVFAGLFDTVASYKGFEDLKLEAVGKAANVLHLTAMDERRHQFELVNVSASKGASFEKALPGVHADIGGSYNESITEISKNLFYGSKDEIEQEIRYYLQDGWFQDESELTVCQGFGRKYIKGERTEVKNCYSFIPLHIMRKKAEKHNNVVFKDQIDKDYRVLPDLVGINRRLNAYVFEKGKPMRYFTPDEIVAKIKRTLTKHQIDQILERIQIIKNEELRSEFGFIGESQNEYHRGSIIIDDDRPALSSFHQYSAKKDKTSLYTKIYPEPDFNPDNETTRDRRLYQYLTKDDYNGYPDLQQIIEDHFELKKLRRNYFHISHECSFGGGLVPIFDPHSKSIRDKPARIVVSK